MQPRSEALVPHGIERTYTAKANKQAVSAKIIIRLFDIVLAFVGLVVLFPVMLLAAIAIKLDSEGPVLFVQKRVGLNMGEFEMMKFRSMRVDAEASGAVWAQSGDKRTTRVGRILRKTRLDELPQLINVLKNEMSLVGPRPIRRCFVGELQSHDDRYIQRFAVKPGLTGYAQLYAPYGSNLDEQLQKIDYDQRYVLNGLSVANYLEIVAKTVVTCVLKPFGK